MTRFNLTFRGEILPGHDPEQVKASLGELFEIDDADRLAQCFSGELVVLRRNLERKEAAEFYARLRRLGIGTELVKIEGRGQPRSDTREPEAERSATAPPRPTPPSPPPITPPQPDPPSQPAAAAAQSGPPPPPAATPQRSAPAAKSAGDAGQPPLRRADLAARHTLRSEDAEQLKAKERALRRALRAKEKEEARRARAAERAREKALAREAAHKARLEAARKKAEQAEQKRLAEEAEARRREEQQRRLAEEEAEREAQAARLRAEQEARLAAERERERAAEQARQEAERVAREAERARLAELERQRQREQQRQAEEKAARRAAQRQAKEQRDAQARVEAARRKRERADEVARRKTEELRQRAEEQARREAAERERQAQRQAMEEQAAQRAAAELGRSGPPAGAKVKTRLELPTRKRLAEGGEARRKRQAGEPNLFSLTPFRNTPAVRARAELSHRAMRRALVASAIALACALVILLRLLGPAPAAGSGNAEAMAVSPQQQLVLLAGQRLLLHDRAGVGKTDLAVAELGLAQFGAPLAFSPEGSLLGVGRLAGSAAGAPASLLRCELETSSCELFSPALAGSAISAVAVHPLDGTVFVADASAGELLKLDAGGELLARSAAPLPARPVLQLDNGLLLVNSAEGTGISVFRYEDEAFGQQLDEILLLPPGSEDAAYAGVTDFLRSGESWWVSVARAGDRDPALLRYDDQWAFIEQVNLPPATRPEELAAWGPRVLVRDHRRLPLQRFDQQGEPQVPLLSDLLSSLQKAQQQRAQLIVLSWRTGLALAILALLASVCLAALYRLRTLVYTSSKERGAEPLDQLAGTITWVGPAPDRAARLARLTRWHAVLAAGLVLTAIGLGVSALQLAALLLALAGPAIALMLLHGSEPGHIGTNGDTLVLADHAGIYHLGAGSRIHYRGPFLMIDDVTVFTGSRWLPVFAADELAQQVAPLARRGVRVDRRIVTVRLLQGRHPLAVGAAAIAACGCGALALLSLPGLG